MIPKDYITEWRREAPWVEDFQVEEDLVISRALVELFSHQSIKDALNPWLGEPKQVGERA